jgi:hypothetical protein
MRRAALLVPVTAALAFAGCGDSSGGGGNAAGDPASIAPKGTVLFVKGKVRPEGGQKDAILDIIRRLGGVQDPSKLITDTISKELQKDKLDFKKDIDPVLGDTAGFAFTSLGSDNDTRGAGIIAVKDEGKAKDLMKRIADGKVTSEDYKGTEILKDSASTDTQVATIDGFLVTGTPDGVRAVIDAAKGDGLDTVQSYKAIADQNEGKLAFGYLDTNALVGALGKSGSLPPAQAAAIQGALGEQLQPVGLSLDVAKGKITFEASSQSKKNLPTEQSTLLPELPGDSFAAIGIPKLGQSIKNQVDALGTGLGGAALDAAETQIKAATGISLQSALATIGDVALFARGESLLTAGGGLIAQVSNEKSATDLLQSLAKLAAQDKTIKVSPVNVGGGSGYELRSADLPGAIFGVVADGKLVITYGKPALDEALKPSSKLGDAADYKSAVSSLSGAAPVLFVTFAPIAKLVAQAGSGDSSTKEVLRVLGELGTLAAGGQSEGSRAVGRLVVNLK